MVELDISGERKVHPSMSEGKRYFVVNGLNQIKTWLRSYSWIGVQRLVLLDFPYLARRVFGKSEKPN